VRSRSASFVLTGLAFLGGSSWVCCGSVEQDAPQYDASAGDGTQIEVDGASDAPGNWDADTSAESSDGTSDVEPGTDAQLDAEGGDAPSDVAEEPLDADASEPDAEDGDVAICSAPLADCDGIAANGCEADLSTDPKNCGVCGNDCGPYGQCCGIAMCVQYAGCSGGFADCDQNYCNGCETNNSTDSNNCGVCGNVCSVLHGTPTCSSGYCTVQSCDAGYADCDKVFASGCETDLASDPAHCGSCSTACSAGQACLGGICQ
jgi:hypothetical protein